MRGSEPLQPASGCLHRQQDPLPVEEEEEGGEKRREQPLLVMAWKEVISNSEILSSTAVRYNLQLNLFFRVLPKRAMVLCFSCDDLSLLVGDKTGEAQCYK